MWADSLDEESFLERCVEACLTFEGDVGRRKKPISEDQEQDAEEPYGPWNIGTAKVIMTVKKQIAREMTEEKLLHFMCEWCETPYEPHPSCCYDDAAILYDDELLPAHQIDRIKLDNCYLRIPHCIKGTVPEAVTQPPKVLLANILGQLASFQVWTGCTGFSKKGVECSAAFHRLVSWGRWSVIVLDASACYVWPQFCLL